MLIKQTILMMSLLTLIGCSSTPDIRIDRNYEDLVKHQSEVQSVSAQLEQSHSKEPEFVTALLDSWDCGGSLCVVGRAEIDSDEASPFSCLEISSLAARANLLSHVKTDLSNRVFHSMSGTSISKQMLEKITHSGFDIKNVSRIKITQNYYRKVLKDLAGTPGAVYQCFTVASLEKRYLKHLIEREIDNRSPANEAGQIKNEIDRVWDSLFKIDSPVSESINTSPDLSHQFNENYDDLQNSVVKVAKAFLGLPYQLGGDLSDGSLDCSNFTRVIYRTIGFNLPRVSTEQFVDNRGAIVHSDLKKGDLLFFNGSLRPKNQVSHVAMYIGNGNMIHANGNKKKITIDDVYEPKWQEKLLGIKRFITTENFPSSVTNNYASQDF